MTASKPREWRLRNGLISFPENVDVIEKSAYLKAVAALKLIAQTTGDDKFVARKALKELGENGEVNNYGEIRS